MHTVKKKSGFSVRNNDQFVADYKPNLTNSDFYIKFRTHFRCFKEMLREKKTILKYTWNITIFSSVS